MIILSGANFFKSSKFGRDFKKSENYDFFRFFEGGAPLRVIRAGIRLTVYRSLPSFSKSNSETTARLVRLGSAENDTTPPKIRRVDNVGSINFKRTQGKTCVAYM